MTISTACSDFPTLVGRQEPEHLSEFGGDDELGGKAVTLGRRCRAVLMPWQVAVLFAMLRVAASGMWAHPECCLIVPRQNGKTLILVLRCLFGLFYLNETIIFSAQRWPTAEKTYKRMWAMIVARPSLRARVVKNTCSQGMGYIQLKSGAEIGFITRSIDSGRGFDEVDLIVYDEAYNLTGGEIDALSWTQMASGNPQTIYASSAVNEDVHSNGEILAGVRLRGLASGEGMYFAEFMAPPDAPRGSLETARLANPSYGVIQTDAKMQIALNACTSEARWRSYGVEALGWGLWPKVDFGGRPTVVDMGLWGDMAEHRPAVSGPIALALEMDAAQQWVTIAAATRTVEGRVRLEIGYLEAPSPKALDKIVDLVVAWDPCCLVMRHNSPAKSMLPDLRAKGIEPEIMSSSQDAEACGGFYTDAVNHALSHASDPRLTEPLEGADKKTMTGGTWVWDEQTGAPLQAATAARWGLITFGADVAAPGSPAFETEATEVDMFDALSAAF